MQSYDDLKSDYLQNQKKLDEALTVVTYLQNQLAHYESKIKFYLGKEDRIQNLMQDIEIQKSQLPQLNPTQTKSELHETIEE